MSTIRIQLAQTTAGSRVWLDDVEISHHVRGFQLTAEVGAISEVTLTLSAPVELEGEVPRVLLNRLDDPEQPPAPRRLERDPGREIRPGSTSWDGRGVLQDGSMPERMRG